MPQCRLHITQRHHFWGWRAFASQISQVYIFISVVFQQMAGKHSVLIKWVNNDNFLKVEIKCFEEECLFLICVKVPYGLVAATIILHAVRLLSICPWILKHQSTVKAHKYFWLFGYFYKFPLEVNLTSTQINISRYGEKNNFRQNNNISS